jgi:ribosomal protein S18 acetylase RimI-like enzyme
MKEINRIQVEIVDDWEEKAIVALFRAGRWWKDGMDPSRIGELIKGSFLFAVAVDVSTGEVVGMGRVISDGVADAYIQDLVVLADCRSMGVGSMIMSALIEGCRSRGIAWIGLIAEPGSDEFYRSLGFKTMEGHVPMLLSPEERSC